MAAAALALTSLATSAMKLARTVDFVFRSAT